MANKYLCPVCGGLLQYWKEYTVTKTQNINPKTGELSVTVQKSKIDDNNNDMQGLQCRNLVCGWSINSVNGTIPENFNNWYIEQEKNIKV